MAIADINNSVASMTNIIWDNCNRDVTSVVASTILNSLQSDVGTIPFGNKKVWKSLQLGDLDCKLAIDLKTSGNILPKKSKNRIVNRLLR